MTREEAIERYEGIRYTVACFTGSKKDCDAVDMAFSALRKISTDKDNYVPATDQFRDITKLIPLTLDELQMMDGKPVWIVEGPDWGHWELSEDAEDYFADRIPEFYGMEYDDSDGSFGLHKQGWFAYAYPPAHLDQKAWSSEWIETMPILGAGNVERHCKKCGYLAEDTYSFCPQCGRPMTPEAWSELEKRLRG